MHLRLVHTAPRGSNYAEWSFFDGYAFQHIAAWQEMQRLERLRNVAASLIDRRRNGRAQRR